MRFAFTLMLAASAFCAAPTLAQLHVPGDHATVQEAIDASAPGGVVIIHGGIWKTLTVDKPLTLVGDPQPIIRGDCNTGGSGPLLPAILLDGPGHGSVVLENLRVIYEGHTGTCASVDPLVLGGGFDRLVVLASELRGADGKGDEYLRGGASIDVQVDSIFVSQSVVVGGSSSTYQFDCDDDDCLAADGQPGILAPGASLVLLDSDVTGGSAQSLEYQSHTGCPTSCDDISGGSGGAGVVVGSLFMANSTITGGAGGVHGCDITSFTCTKPDGVPIAATQIVQLDNSLIASGAIPLGGSWGLTWSAPSPMAWLALSLTTPAPIWLDGKGWLFMDLNAMLLRPIAGGGMQSTTFAIANDPTVAGLVVTAQVYDAITGLSRPVTAPILP